MSGKSKATKGERVQALRDFNARVDLLRTFAVSRLVKKGLLKTLVQIALDEPESPGTRLPTQEEIHAFVCNLRLFIQENDATSFRNISESYAALGVSPELKDRFEACRGRLNEWLDSKSSLGMGSGPLRNRRIFEVFVYGEIAHSNPKKRRELERWRENTLFFPLLETHFVNIMAKFMRFLEEVVVLNTQALSELRLSA